MKSIDDEIKNEISKGFELKDIASKSTEKLDLYFEAAKYFKKDALLSAKAAEDASNSLDSRIESKIFTHYYSGEANICLGIYYYQKHETGTAKTYYKKSLNELSRALKLLHKLLPRVSSENKDYFKKLLSILKYTQYTCTADLLASDARAAWDKGCLMEAFDLYKEIINRYHKILEYARSKKLGPVYERVAVSNYRGVVANVTKILERVLIRSKVARVEGSSDPFLPIEDAVELIHLALESSRHSRRAYRNNPEREEHSEDARRANRDIQNCFQNNKSFWLRFYIEFENEPEILTLMKMIDLELFNEIENRRFSKTDSVNREETESDEQNIFRKQSDKWVIRYDGKTIEPNDSKGLACIAYLLSKPGSELSVIKVYLEVYKPPAWKISMRYSQMTQEQLAEHGLSESFPDAGIELADEKALADYQREFKKLQKEYGEILQERQKARENDDPSYPEDIYLEDKRRVEEEIQKLAKHIQSVTGRKGEIRETADEIERIRKSITMAISRARKKIKDKYKHESLAIHLQAIKTGSFVSYKPEDLPDWQL
jgi:ElaB/YqjD/DUF883 family membrane-anchored ribosome-binding protein